MNAINDGVALLNDWGRACCGFAERMLLQSSILIGLLLIADLCLRKKVSARFRYGMWLLVLVKLALPPSLAMPTGAAYWLGKYLPTASTAPAPAAAVVPPIPGVYTEPIQTFDALPVREVAAVVAPHIASLQWPGWMLLGWIAGVLLLSAMVFHQIASMRRSLKRSSPAESAMIGLLEECCAELGRSTRAALRLTNDLHSPAVCGFLRPMILLPATMPPRLWPDGLRTILMHELTHIKRRDPWLSLVQTILQVAYFWHPLVWAANARLRYLRELAVDEIVVAGLRSQAQCYTDTLIDIAAMAFRKPAFSLRLIGIAESKRALERRITHMLNHHTSKRPALGVTGLLAILAIGAVLVPMGQGGTAAPAAQNTIQIAPALPPGIAELFGLSKDDILKKFGAPRRIFYRDQTYTLDNLPDEYFMVYEDVSFIMSDGTAGGITLLSPTHVFGNGVCVGNSEEKVKQAFGPPSEIEETEFKDFLIYESLGLSFEINKQDRTVMEINIGKDYGDPAQVQAYANAAQFTAQLPQKIAGFDIDAADLKQVLATFGQPVKYIWGRKTLSADELPNRFIAVYPGNFQVFMLNNRVVEIRHEGGSKYAFAGKLRVGSTLEEAMEVLGPPVKTVEGVEIDWQNAKNVLFWDIEGTKGHGYYHRPDHQVRVWFWNGKVSAIYMTRSNYGDDDAEPSDPEFARRLAQRVAELDIDAAGPEQVKKIFGEPTQYIWGNQAFAPDALPRNYIMCYPCGFYVWFGDGRIREIRHRWGSPYVYRDRLRIGSTVQEVLDLLGQPDETVTGQECTFKDRVLYKDMDGTQGYHYYHRTDQRIRVWFKQDKVMSFYMTRSDFPAAR
jgi:beta-lactamase regulating signal transducer with metallopeptidase domain